MSKIEEKLTQIPFGSLVLFFRLINFVDCTLFTERTKIYFS